MRVPVCVCVFQVKELMWNSDSTVLAVWLEDMTAGEEGVVNTYSKSQAYMCLGLFINGKLRGRGRGK